MRLAEQGETSDNRNQIIYIYFFSLYNIDVGKMLNVPKFVSISLFNAVCTI